MRHRTGVRHLRLGQRRRRRLTGPIPRESVQYLLPAWLLTLRRGTPDLEVAASIANSHEVCAQVRAGNAHLGFVEAPAVPSGLSSAQVGTDRLALVVAAGYPLARRKQALRPTDLLDLPLLLREPGSGTRDTLLDALGRSVGRAPELPHAVELGSTTTILATARAGGGVSVVSARAVAGDATRVEVPVRGLDLVRPLTAVGSASGRRNPRPN